MTSCLYKHCNGSVPTNDYRRTRLKQLANRDHGLGSRYDT